ncbi:hypothetical protein ACTHSL_11915 [Neisseria sp. P0008.S010]|uniref:hypothetical protein n=1 Tax=Neisseria sp. P0008.S010 TaxID=3436707 RepID=UPI003F7FD268
MRLFRAFASGISLATSSGNLPAAASATTNATAFLIGIPANSCSGNTWATIAQRAWAVSVCLSSNRAKPSSHGIKPNCRIFLFCRSGFFTSAGNTGTLANNVAACFSRMAA